MPYNASWGGAISLGSGGLWWRFCALLWCSWRCPMLPLASRYNASWCDFLGVWRAVAFLCVPLPPLAMCYNASWCNLVSVAFLCLPSPWCCVIMRPGAIWCLWCCGVSVRSLPSPWRVIKGPGVVWCLWRFCAPPCDFLGVCALWCGVVWRFCASLWFLCNARFPPYAAR